MAEQKQTKFLTGSPEQRLKIALEMIGVEDSDPKHHRYNLVSSIMLYAGNKGDDAFEAACEKHLGLIKSERLEAVKHLEPHSESTKTLFSKIACLGELEQAVVCRLVEGLMELKGKQ